MLELRQLSKRFADFQALDGVSFSVNAGEIVGLLGENGAGKSTLLKIVGGEISSDGGELRWLGEPLRLKSPRQARACGIGVVHQHFMLAPVFTVAENVALHNQTSALFNAPFWEKQVETWAADLGWKINGAACVETLSVGEQQRVEILKALFTNAATSQPHHPTTRLLLLDEPTANLTPGEVDELIVVLRRLKSQGCAIVFVSHKLHEVIALCDRVTVLRHGKVTGERVISQTNANELAALMVGRAVDETTPRAAPGSKFGARELKIENLSCGLLRDLSLTVRGGEIVGIAGVVGNGQQDLVEALSSLHKLEGGSFRVEENGAACAGELGVIPADRLKSGLIADFDIAENFTLHPAPRRTYRSVGRLKWKSLRSLARGIMDRFDVRTPASRERTLAGRLSGGNQQKVVVARALSFAPSAIIAADPARGLDVGAAQFVRGQLQNAAANGVPVLLISTDLDEVLHLCDRIGVLYEGKLLPTAGLLPAGTPRETIGALMGGAQ